MTTTVLKGCVCGNQEEVDDRPDFAPKSVDETTELHK